MGQEGCTSFPLDHTAVKKLGITLMVLKAILPSSSLCKTFRTLYFLKLQILGNSLQNPTEQFSYFLFPNYVWIIGNLRDLNGFKGKNEI